MMKYDLTFLFKIKENFEIGEPFTEEENKILLTHLTQTTQNFEENFYDRIIGLTLLKKCPVNLETFSEVIRQFVRSRIFTLDRDYFSQHPPICLIEEFPENDNSEAKSSFGRIILSKKLVKKLYAGRAEFLKIIFHELSHVNDYLTIKKPILAIEKPFFVTDLLLKTMDILIMKYLSEIDFSHIEQKVYYQTNYPYLSFEIAAEINGYRGLLNYLSNLGALTTKKQEQEIYQYMWELEKKRENHLRITENLSDVPADIMCVEDLFLHYFQDQPSILNEYPVLNANYTMENGKMREKTEEEKKAFYQQIYSSNGQNSLKVKKK